MNRIKHNYSTPGHPLAFSAPSRFKNYYKNKYGISQINDEFSKLESYTLHKQYRKPKYSNPFFAYKPREQFQIDLIDLDAFKNYNDKVRYLLSGIDIFSKRADVIPMKRKTGKENVRALNELFQNLGIPKTIVCDRDRKSVV